MVTLNTLLCQQLKIIPSFLIAHFAKKNTCLASLLSRQMRTGAYSTVIEDHSLDKTDFTYNKLMLILQKESPQHAKVLGRYRVWTEKQIEEIKNLPETQRFFKSP